MADKFGAAHRQLVKDTNEGKVSPPESRRSTAIRTSGAGTTTVGSDDKSALYKGLLNIGTGILKDMKGRKDERDYVEGYNKGLDEGYAETQRSPIQDMIFGPSPTLRGAQKRIVENDSRRWLNARMKSIENDMISFDEDEYQTELNDQLRLALEDHDDPEIKAQLTATASKHFETLARNHTQARAMWVADSNQRAVEGLMDSGVLGMQNAQRYGDTTAQMEAQQEAEQMFDQPLDMSHEAWLETTGRVIIKHLSDGNDLAYRLAEKKGIIATMLPQDQKRIQTAQSLFEAKNSRAFHTDTMSLETQIQKGTADDAALVAYKLAYPQQGKDLNRLREEKFKADAVLAEIARQKALTINELVSGDVAFASREPKEQQDAVTNTFNAMADKGLKAIRADMYEKGEFEGDMEADFTAEQRMDYMLDNPMVFAQTWAKHPEVKTPMVQNLMTGVISDFRNENLDENGIAAMEKRVAALKQFQSLDGGNFHNQFRSQKDAQDFNVYSYMVDAGFNPINAVRELRLVKDMPEIELADYADSLDEGMEDLADEFLDQSPESQGWLGLYNKTPDNEQAFDSELKSRLAEALTIYKGDMSKALPAASAAIRRNGLVANGQFIPNGRALDIKGGSLEDYIRGLNADDAMRTQITNSGNGFAPDVDYTTLELSANPFNKKAVLMHGRHETTGQPITISLNLPQHGSHFSTYGFNSFTGYNPNIADTEERKAVFLRNNKLLSTYKTIGKAIDQAIK